MELEWLRISEPEGRRGHLLIDASTAERRGSPLEEGVKAVQRITSLYEPPFTLLVSGGIDSQAMIECWLASGVPFNVRHITFGCNVGDFTSTVEFCHRRKLPVEVVGFNVKGFIESPELVEMARRYDTTSPQLLSHAKAILGMDDTCIMAGNFTAPLNIGLSRTQLGLLRAANLDKPSFIPFFLQSTPELAYSMIECQLKSTLEDCYADKCRAYLESGFDIIPQKTKLTGFEEIKASYDDVQVPSRLRLLFKNEPSARPFDLLYRYNLYSKLDEGYYSESFKLKHPDWVKELI